MTDVDLAAAGERPRNRRTLLLMIGTLVFVIAAATTLYQLAESGVVDLPAMLGTSNRGALIDPPLAMGDLELRTELGEVQDYAALPVRWTFLVAAPGECGEQCRQNLYVTRQVRIALGRDQPRIRRILLTGVDSVGGSFRDWLRREHEDLLILHAAPAVVAGLRDGIAGVAQPDYFVVDPQGWLMMAYGQQQNPEDLMKDMKFLLKYSSAPSAAE